MRTLPNDEEGRIDSGGFERAIRPENIHSPRTTLLCLENTHNRCSGAAVTPDYTSTIAELAHQHGLAVHWDGARVFNAAVALNVLAGDLARAADSVCFCVSKGLSAPVGSLLCGSQEFVVKARKWRKMMGGGMRQAGVIAAAGIVALEKMVSRLVEDHANALSLAHGLARIPGITINPEKVQTSIVLFESPSIISGAELAQRMDAQGVKLLPRGGQKIRAVTHRMVGATDIDEALNRFGLVVKEL